ncbi:MAG: hypothetical protein IPM56_04850 [Ignavibacteriales bacterium]|nr:MAG: hypothetical protein IPM56_04850 [Ignavibacteriales bacterium]
MKKFLINDMIICKKIILLVLICTAFILNSCREEIVPPGNPAGNINEPVQESYIDYYTFKINASNITFSKIDYTYFNATTNYLSFSLLDHKSGHVDLEIWSRNNVIIYSTRFTKDFSRTIITIDGNVPELIRIKLNDFTGKVSIELSRY